MHVMKALNLFLLLSVTLLFACSDKKEKASQTDQRYKEVMAVHDEIMPKMAYIMKLKTQLKDKVTELNAEPNIDTTQISQLELAIVGLENSHEGMMGWMRQFNRQYDGMAEEEILQYLDMQMDKIEKVGEVTNAALQDARERLGE
jgi:predicted nuclease with TOPRIM domain